MYQYSNSSRIVEGLLNIKELYVDGAKIEANANRYIFLWGKSIKTNCEKMKQQIGKLWQYAQSIAAAEVDLMVHYIFSICTIVNKIIAPLPLTTEEQKLN